MKTQTNTNEMNLISLTTYTARKITPCDLEELKFNRFIADLNLSKVVGK